MRSTLYKILLVIGTILCAAPGAGALSTAETAHEDLPDLAVIHRATLMADVERLASAELGGRLAGSPGYARAAEEAAARFSALGLLHGGDDGYFQHLEIEHNEIEVCRLSIVDHDGAVHPLDLGPEFVCRGLTGSGEFTATVVFVGYGMSAPDRGYDDYGGVDVRGRVVLAFKEPPPFQVDSTGWGDAWMPRPKALTAAERGARALLLVSRPNQERPQKPIGSMFEGDGERIADFPSLQVDVSTAEAMLQSAGLDLVAIAGSIDSTQSPRSLTLPISVEVQVRAVYDPRRVSSNVIGILPGRDPALRNTYVVAGAHLDHVGVQGGAERPAEVVGRLGSAGSLGSVGPAGPAGLAGPAGSARSAGSAGSLGTSGAIYFPGANDNASGSAVVLALAEAFTRAEVRPRRSVVFALWTSEEAGLYGSRHFVEHPTVPKDSLFAYVNFDCVGHGDSIQVGGGESYPRLWEIARDLDSQGARLMVERTRRGGGADAQPFEEAGIPNLCFVSEFSYTHLHLTSDTPATLNPVLLEGLARLAYGTVWKIAEGDEAD